MQLLHTSYTPVATRIRRLACRDLQRDFRSFIIITTTVVYKLGEFINNLNSPCKRELVVNFINLVNLVNLLVNSVNFSTWSTWSTWSTRSTRSTGQLGRLGQLGHRRLHRKVGGKAKGERHT